MVFSEHDGHLIRKETVGRINLAIFRALWWMGLCLLFTSCSTAPFSAHVTPTSRGPVAASPITVYRGQTSTISAVAWSKDGTRIASGGNDETVQVWEARTGHRFVLYSGHTAGVRSLAWSPDGTRIASGSDDSTVQIWNVATGRLLLTYHGHTAGVRSLAWSPDGTRIVSGGNDNTIQVWNATTGQRLLTYTGHLGAIFSVAWSPNGACIASATGNTSGEQQRETIQVWNATTGQQFSIYAVPSSPTSSDFDGTFSLAWSPDGKHFASGGADTQVHLWRAPPCPR